MSLAWHSDAGAASLFCNANKGVDQTRSIKKRLIEATAIWWSAAAAAEAGNVTRSLAAARAEMKTAKWEEYGHPQHQWA
jgi:hypothetical protein